MKQAVALPGCLKLIQGKAVSERAARGLSKDCQTFRRGYLEELKLLSQDSKKFSHSLSQQIRRKKSFEPPYHALLIATFPEKVSEEVKTAIAERAKLENAKKMKYRYAVAAEERISKGSCSSSFAESAYDEICRTQDDVYRRIEKLAVAP